MQATTTPYPSESVRRGLHSENYFPGLPEGVTHYQLLHLVRDVGHEIGFTASDIQHLDYLISHTRPLDWLPGGKPVVYKSVSKIARERGIGERQVHNRETKLHRLGVLSWNDIGNYRRTGHRNAEGQIIFAYGVDLSPLAELYVRLVEAKARLIEDLAAFDSARRRLSAVRRRIRAKLAEARALGLDIAELAEQEAALRPIRADWSRSRQQAVLDLASSIEARLDQALATTRPATPASAPAAEGSESSGSTLKTSDQSEENFRHIQPTNKTSSSREDTSSRVAVDDREGKRAGGGRENQHIEAASSTGIEHVTLRQAISAASDDFLAGLRPSSDRIGVPEFVDAAATRCHHLGINRSAWADACATMGRFAAAVAVLIIDRNQHHPDTPIRSPGGALRAMTARARRGELHLHKSLFGILDRNARCRVGNSGVVS